MTTRAEYLAMADRADAMRRDMIVQIAIRPQPVLSRLVARIMRWFAREMAKELRARAAAMPEEP